MFSGYEIGSVVREPVLEVIIFCVFTFEDLLAECLNLPFTDPHNFSDYQLGVGR